MKKAVVVMFVLAACFMASGLALYLEAGKPVFCSAWGCQGNVGCEDGLARPFTNCYAWQECWGGGWVLCAGPL